MKPAENQFQIEYETGRRYNPDFVVETDNKSRNVLLCFISSHKSDSVAISVFSMVLSESDEMRKGSIYKHTNLWSNLDVIWGNVSYSR